ncbi:TM2 domain-containing protein [Flocculibacter collagenilyticus]|uniref:TM2 domain-containing protein n=1 Tax=Flocculibacter collagenilyticus TaxID=2744479 RepID=UPI0018F6D196|nr:TM2 domain-containing protein [Flocculibacter collagenilyticus]
MDIDLLKMEEDQLRKEIATLSDEQKRIYYQIEKSQVKDPDTYAVLNWFFVAGLHHFYLGENGRGMINVIVMLVGLITISSFGIWIILSIFIFELPQLFNSQKIVQHYNNEVMKSALEECKKMHSGIARSASHSHYHD